MTTYAYHASFSESIEHREFARREAKRGIAMQVAEHIPNGECFTIRIDEQIREPNRYGSHRECYGEVFYTVQLEWVQTMRVVMREFEPTPAFYRAPPAPPKPTFWQRVRKAIEPPAKPRDWAAFHGFKEAAV